MTMVSVAIQHVKVCNLQSHSSPSMREQREEQGQERRRRRVEKKREVEEEEEEEKRKRVKDVVRERVKGRKSSTFRE